MRSSASVECGCSDQCCSPLLQPSEWFKDDKLIGFGSQELCSLSSLNNDQRLNTHYQRVNARFLWNQLTDFEHPPSSCACWCVAALQIHFYSVYSFSFAISFKDTFWNLTPRPIRATIKKLINFIQKHSIFYISASWMNAIKIVTVYLCSTKHRDGRCYNAVASLWWQLEFCPGLNTVPL